MKKTIKIFVFIILLLGLIPISSFALSNENSSNITVKLNGKQVLFDTQPVTVEGRTLVPVRAIFESLGAQVNWNDSTKTITATTSNTKVQLSIDKNTAYINDKPIVIDVAPKIINNRTMVPLRFISESFGAIVTWNDLTRTIDINYEIPSDVPNASVEENTKNYDFRYYRTNIPYISSDNGLTVVLKKIDVIYKSGYKEYNISYSEENKTKDKAIDQGHFKVYFEDGSSQPQYGNFGKLYPGDKQDRVFSFKTINNKPLLIEYGNDLFFKKEPTSETLKWKL